MYLYRTLRAVTLSLRNLQVAIHVATNRNADARNMMDREVL